MAYIIGYEKLFETLRTYYSEWKFKHPLPNDFRRIAERVSGIQLQWYLTDWTQTTNKIDYAIDSVVDKNNLTVLRLKRKELMPMPLEILVVLKNGETELHYIPISLMRGEKQNTYKMSWKVHPDWSWSHTDYFLEINHPKKEIEAIIIDPSNLMADINKTDNYFTSKK